MNKSRLSYATLLLCLCYQTNTWAATCFSNILESTPATAFNQTAVDGTVTDNSTGLIWSRCSLGQSWNPTASRCDGTASSLNWQQALQQANANALAGQNDWRVPNIKELASIVERRCINPSINEVVFPNNLSALYWSSSVFNAFSGVTWGINFSSGDDEVKATTTLASVRLVRAGQAFSAFGVDSTLAATISVVASDGLAAEQNLDSGVFTISRGGSTDQAITVNFSLTGSAVNGTDYNGIFGQIDFLIGQTTKIITITPIDDTEAEGDESVLLTLQTGTNYVLGANTTATVNISDNEASNSFAPVSLSSSGEGEVLFFPYYTTRKGYSTFLSITNSSARELALRINIREGRNGRICADYNVILSRFDMLVSTIEEGSATPRIRFTDSSCVFPVDGTEGPKNNRFVNFATDSFVGANADNGPTTLDRCREGFVEVIQLGSRLIADSNTPDGNGIIRTNAPDCNVVEADFTNNIATLRSQYEEPVNALKGTYTLIKGVDGKAVGGEAKALANYLTGSNSSASNLLSNNLLVNPATPVTLGDNRILSSRLNITAEHSPQTRVEDVWFSSIDAVSASMTATNIHNRWSGNPLFGAETALIVTMPTKQYFVDAGGPLSGLATNSAAVPPFDETFQNNADGKACYPVRFKLFDRVSSFQQQPDQLCNQVNIITFNGVNLFGSQLAVNIDTGSLGANSGWLDIELNNDNAAGHPNSLGTQSAPATRARNVSAKAYLGVPVIGAAITTRTRGTVTGNYGTLWEHTYRREVK
jgi:hypothetical protein